MVDLKSLPRNIKFLTAKSHYGGEGCGDMQILVSQRPNLPSISTMFKYGKKIIPTAIKYRVYIVACQQGGVSSENHHNQPLNDARQKILARKWISLVYQPNDVDTAMDI